MELAFGCPVQTQMTVLHNRSWRSKPFARLVPIGSHSITFLMTHRYSCFQTLGVTVPSIQHMSLDCFLCLRWFKSISRLVLPTEQQTHATFLLVSYPSVTVYLVEVKASRGKESGAKHTDSQQSSNEHPLGRRKGNWTTHTPGSPDTPSLWASSLKLHELSFSKRQKYCFQKSSRTTGFRHIQTHSLCSSMLNCLRQVLTDTGRHRFWSHAQQENISGSGIWRFLALQSFIGSNIHKSFSDCS